MLYEDSKGLGVRGGRRYHIAGTVLDSGGMAKLTPQKLN
jgi:hypothetical protein